MAKEAIFNERLLQRLTKLDPDLKKTFLKCMREMYDQESRTVTDFIGEGRQSIQESLAILDEMNDSQGRTSSASYSDSLSQQSKHTPRKERPNSLSNLRKRATVSPMPQPKPSSAPQTPMSYEQESKEILDTLKNVSAYMENERSRQAELVRQMKAKKKAKMHEITTREDMMVAILQEADQVELYKQKTKERQEQKLKDRLSELKKFRAETPVGETPTPRIAAVTPEVFYSIDETDTKKKKKKHKDKEEGEREEEAIHRENKRRAKKKDTDIQNEEAQAVHDEEAQTHEKKNKSKKKSKDTKGEESNRTDDDSVKKEKKKKKKKALIEDNVMESQF